MESKNSNVENETSLPGEKETYLVPQIEILEIRVEKGFAASPVNTGGSGNSDWGWGSW